MPRWPALTFRWLSAAGLFVGALAVGGYLARPVSGASIGFDSQVAVVDFARLLSGRHVEVFLSTTPKPLLTFVFGPLELLTHDWRTLSWATLIAFGSAVALTAELVRRVGGPMASAFVGVALAGCGALLFDVGYALAIPWALLGWSIAGLALCRAEPRFGLAGIALLLASLARLETLLIVSLAAAVLVVLQLTPLKRVERWGLRHPPRRAWLVLIAAGAVPIMAVHDQLIYGDPLFWSTVSTRYSEATAFPILSPIALLGSIVIHYVRLWPLMVLGLLGFLRLIRGQAWVILLGLLAMGPGAVCFLLLLATGHIYVPERYLAPIDIAAIVAAGIGIAWLLDGGHAYLTRRQNPAPERARFLAGGAIGISVLLALVATWPSGILDESFRASVGTSLALAADLDQMDPVLREIVARTPSARTWPTVAGTPVLLLVPPPYRPRLSIDLDVPLTIVGAIMPKVGPAGGHPLPGEFIAHDRHDDESFPLFQFYESSIVLAHDGISVVPVASNPVRGWWITEIQAFP